MGSTAIFYGDEYSVKLCKKAFQFPFYPLSLGRPDDIANAIVHSCIKSDPEDLYTVRNTVISGLHPVSIDEKLFDIDDPKDHGPCTLVYRLDIHLLTIRPRMRFTSVCLVHSLRRPDSDFVFYIFIFSFGFSLSIRQAVQSMGSTAPDVPVPPLVVLNTSPLFPYLFS